MAMHVDIEDQQSSALDRVRSAVQRNTARRERIEATGKKWIPSPRRQIYIGNIAFNATAQDVSEAIDEVTNNYPVRPVVDFRYVGTNLFCWHKLIYPSRIDSDRLGYWIIVSESMLLLGYYYFKCLFRVLSNNMKPLRK